MLEIKVQVFMRAVFSVMCWFFVVSAVFEEFGKIDLIIMQSRGYSELVCSKAILS